jgi:hypothetical protein
MRDVFDLFWKYKDRGGGANPPPTIQAAPVISPGLPQQQAAMSNADFQVFPIC